MGNALYDWPQGRNVTQYQIGDDLSKTLSNQTLKFGIKFRRNDVSDHDYGVYTSGRAFVTLGDFASGYVNNYYMQQNFPSNLSNPTGTGPLSLPAALYSLAGYVEDDWRVKSNLTLTFAARLEHYSNPVCQTNCFARLTGPFADVSHDPDQPYNEAINTGLHQALQGLHGDRLSLRGSDLLGSRSEYRRTWLFAAESVSSTTNSPGRWWITSRKTHRL